MCPASGRFVWAISGVGQSNGLVCSRSQGKKEKNRRLTANFAHAQPRPFEPIVTKFCDCAKIDIALTEVCVLLNALSVYFVLLPTTSEIKLPIILNAVKLYIIDVCCLLLPLDPVGGCPSESDPWPGPLNLQTRLCLWVICSRPFDSVSGRRSCFVWNTP